MKKLLTAAAALLTLAFATTGSAQAGMANLAGVKTTAGTETIVKVGRRGHFGGGRRFHRFGHWHRYHVWRPHYVYYDGCAHYWRKWKATGSHYWRRQYFGCKHGYY